MSKRLLLFPLLVWMFSGCASAPPDDSACPPVTASPEVLARSDARFPVIAAGDRGDDVAIAWQSTVGGPVLARRRFEGIWTTPAPVSPAGAMSPVLVATPDGPVLVSDAAPAERRGLWISDGTPDGGWSPPRPITTAAGTRVRFPAASAGADGTLVVVWRADPAGALMLRSRATTGVWSPPRVVVAGNDIRDPVVALAGDGRAVLAWIEIEDGHRVVRTAEWADGRVSAPVARSPQEETATDLVGGRSTTGAVVLAWRGERGGRTQQVRSVARSADGRWFQTRALGAARTFARGLPRPPGPLSRAPSVAVRNDATAVVAWPEQRDGIDTTVAVVLDGAGGVQQESVLSAGGRGGTVALATAADGRVVAVWEHLDDPVLSLRRVELDGTRWTGCRTLTRTGREPAGPVLAAGGGRVWAAWGVSNDSSVEAESVYP
ncbi:MAG: hypothetical protein H6531_08765 [Actinobacteria bacterium]|nr:hypothetical protein [Actinomycetota bacterium]